MAGLTWSDMTEIELLSWLKRHRRKFADVLEKTGLSFQSVSTVRLLKELSKRRDLGNALLETGLGAGADFDCAQDESPRDGGCQVRCQHGDCTRAQSVCGQISHCVRIDVNRDKSWATLKSLQVYSPRPAPTCDGYVFSAKGGDPQPLDAPVIVKLEVVVPREDWCYRDTAFSEAVQAAYRHERPDRNCTMARCFDVQRCTHAAEGPLPLFVGVETPKGEDMVRLPECLRQTERQAIVDSPDKACALLPTVNMNCQWDQCDPETHSLLLALPSWLHGRNHIIWDYNDAGNVKYRTDLALFMKTSMSIDHYRQGFDVPFPLLPNGVATRVTPEELQATHGPLSLIRLRVLNMLNLPAHTASMSFTNASHLP
ncbi:MAG: hypothetical protein SGPRY_008284 [Prymnesium sp.]